MKFCLLLIFLCFFTRLASQEAPSVLIIGGGLTGLATAIEAKLAGAKPMIIEKRARYTREQYVFLEEASLNLLQKWDVCLPELVVGDLEGNKMGVLKIYQLELGLAQRVEALGIPKITGQFTSFENRRALISLPTGIVELPYDLLIGADGAYSTVRAQAHIPMTCFSKSFGRIAFVPNSLIKFDTFSYTLLKHDSYFLTKIMIPHVTLISIQGDIPSALSLSTACTELGWHQEAETIASNPIQYVENIYIPLQQADAFCNTDDKVLILGDAAATASFLTGGGANCAFESVTAAATFFNTKQTEQDFTHFNLTMKGITDRLIQENLFLFPYHE